MKYKSAKYQVGAIRLHVVETGPEDGPLLMFLHGFPEFWYGWHNQMPFFADQGFRVVAPDQRGYNLSDKPPLTKDYTVDKLVQDIVQLVEALGRSKVILVGHDWGGIVGWCMAMWYPERLEKLIILNAPHPAVMLTTLRDSLKQKIKSLYAGFFQLPWVPELIFRGSGYQLLTRMMQRSSGKGTFSSKDLAQYRKAMRRPGSIRAMLNWYRAARFEVKTLEKKRMILVPTLLLWGKKDQFMNAEMAQHSIDLCEQGTLCYLETASHWLHHEESLMVNSLIHQFINKEAEQARSFLKSG